MNIMIMITSTLLVGVTLLSTHTQAQPQNDVCDDAISLGVGDNEGGTTSSATIDLDVDECAGTSGVGLGVWYTITGTGRPFLATTCDDDTSFDTQLSVFDGDCGDLFCVAGGDDDISCSSFAQSTVIWETEDGQEYYILVHGFGGENGDFRLIIEELGLENDQCNNAIVLDIGDEISGSTEGAFNSFNIDECQDISGNGLGVWYVVQGNGRMLSATTCDGDTTYDSQLSIYRGDCDDLLCVGGNDEDFSCNDFSHSTVVWEAEDNEDYYIFVHGFFESTGDFVLRIQEMGHENDQCDNAYNIDIDEYLDGSTLFDNIDNEDSCGDASETVAPGVWYYIEGQEMAQVLRATTCFDDETTFNTQISVFYGNCGNLRCVDGNNDDEDCDDDYKSTVTWRAEMGEEYYILIHGAGDELEMGDFGLEITAIGPGNDRCNDALFLGIDDSIDGSTDDADYDDYVACGDVSGNDAPGVWYYIEGNGHMLRAHTCERGHDTQLLVFRGDCDELICVDGNDDGNWEYDDEDCGVRSSVVWESRDRVDYYIYVYGRNGDVGNFELVLQDIGPDNDSCEDYIYLRIGDDFRGSTLFATSDTSVGCGFGNENGVWFRTERTDANSFLRVNTCDDDTAFETQVSIFVGQSECRGLSCLGSNAGACNGRSSFIWFAEEDVYYYVLLSGVGGQMGEYRIELENITPGNDNCSNRRRLSIGESILDSTEWATVDNFVNDCGSVSNNKGPGLWYIVTGNGRFLRARTCDLDTTFDTQISVFTSADGCGDLSCVGGNNNRCGTRSSFDWESQSGTEYYILVYGAGSNERGEFRLSIEDISPVNDYCNNMVQLDINENILGSTEWATDDRFVSSCGSVANRNGVWYIVTGNGRFLRAHTCNMDTRYDAQISVFTGAGCGSLRCVDGITNTCRGGTRTSFDWEAQSGANYYILIYGVGNNDRGEFRLSIEDITPSNDICTGAIGTPIRQQIFGSTAFATSESFDVTCPSTTTTPATTTTIAISSVWYMIIGTGQPLVAHACDSGTAFAAQISVFAGNSCNGLTCVDGTSSMCPSSNSSMVTWESTLGMVYYILVHGGDGDSDNEATQGNFVLNIQEFQPILAGAVRPAGCGCPCGRRDGMWVKLRNDEANSCVSPDQAFNLMLNNGASCAAGCCKCKAGCRADRVSVRLSNGEDYCVSEVLANILITEEGVGTCAC